MTERLDGWMPFHDWLADHKLVLSLGLGLLALLIGFTGGSYELLRTLDHPLERATVVSVTATGRVEHRVKGRPCPIEDAVLEVREPGTGAPVRWHRVSCSAGTVGDTVPVVRLGSGADTEIVYDPPRGWDDVGGMGAAIGGVLAPITYLSCWLAQLRYRPSRRRRSLARTLGWSLP